MRWTPPCAWQIAPPASSSASSAPLSRCRMKFSRKKAEERMYIVVTGAAGFIGSNIAKALSDRGEWDVLAVDDLKQGDKFANLVDSDIADYLDKDDFLRELNNGAFDGAIAAISHQGACSDTTEA